jgi:hypothetical protein
MVRLTVTSGTDSSWPKRYFADKLDAIPYIPVEKRVETRLGIVSFIQTSSVLFFVPFIPSARSFTSLSKVELSCNEEWCLLGCYAV